MKFAEMYADIKPSGMLKLFQAAAATRTWSTWERESRFRHGARHRRRGGRAAKGSTRTTAPSRGTGRAAGRLQLRSAGTACRPPRRGHDHGRGVQSVHLALQALLNPGDEVIVAEPCFSPYFEQIYQHRGVAVHLPTTEAQGFVPSGEDIERLITPRSRVLMICSPSNPTGRVMQREQMESIARAATRPVVSPTKSLLHGLHRNVPFATVPAKERTLTMGGLSETRMTGWRIRYGIGRAADRVMSLIGANQT